MTDPYSRIHRDDGKRFIARADDKLTASLERGELF
jgi:hypothetical protein